MLYIKTKEKKIELIKKRRLQNLIRAEKEKKDAKNWKNTSLQPEKRPQIRRYMPDDYYNAVMRLKEPVYKFLIQNFQFKPKDPIDKLKHPITIIGIENMPLAIELSVWHFPVILYVKTQEEKRKVEENLKVHAGELKIEVKNFYKGIKRNKIIVFFDDGDSLNPEQLKEYIKYLKTRCKYLVFALKDSKHQKEILDLIKPFSIIKKYGNYLLVISY